MTREAVSAPRCLQTEISGIQEELCQRPGVPSHVGHPNESIRLCVQVFPRGKVLGLLPSLALELQRELVPWADCGACREAGS